MRTTYVTSAQADQRLCCSLLDSIIPPLAITEVSRLQLFSSADQAGLSLNWSQIPKTGFLMALLIYLFLTTPIPNRFRFSMTMQIPTDNYCICLRTPGVRHGYTRFRPNKGIIELRHEKTCFWGFPTRFDSNRSAQLQRLARGLNVQSQQVQVLCYLCNDQKTC